MQVFLVLALLNPFVSVALAGTNLSEAKRLYCAACGAECRVQPKAIDSVDWSAMINSEGNRRLSLHCHCRSVFDLHQGEFVCKNVGVASAKLLEAKRENRKVKLEAKANSNSEARGSQTVSPKNLAPISDSTSR